MSKSSNRSFCPCCNAAVVEQISHFIYFECTSSVDIKTDIIDQSRKCAKRESVIIIKILEFLKEKRS